MPALPNVPNVLRCRFHWSDASDANVYSTMYFEYSGSAPSGTNCAAIGLSLNTDLAGTDPNWSPRVSLLGCEVTDLTSPTSGQGNSNVSHPGTESGTDLAGGTAVVVSYTINRRYRGGKPRNYFPWFVAEDLTTRQAWSASRLGTVNAALTSMFSSMVGTTVAGTTLSNHVNVSYYEGFTVEGGTGGKRAKNVPTLRATPVVDVITGFDVLARPGSQRRRNV